MLFKLLQLSKEYTLWTNDFIKIHLINHNPQQDFILYFCLRGYDIEYSDRLPEFELNICHLFLVENVHTVHHKTYITVTFTARDPLHYGLYAVHISIQ